MIEMITTAIIAAAPTIASIVGIITACIKMRQNNKSSSSELLNEFKIVKQEVLNTKEYETVKAELALAHKENRELKKIIKELLTKLDKVERPEEE